MAESPISDRKPNDDVTVRITTEQTFSGKEAWEWASANALPISHVEFIHSETGETITEWEPRDQTDR